jgi:hypothetical protein
MMIELSLLLAVIVKIGVLISLTYILLRKWIYQDRKYMTDFPFLMAIGFVLFAITKLFDIYLYEQYGSIDELLNFTDDEAVNYARWRFSLGIISVFPVMLLMLIIWFEDRKKIQFIIGFSWLLVSFISLFSSQTLKQFLLVSQIYSIPPLLLSCITYLIIHKQKKIPTINSLLLGIGWSCFIIVQIFRPMFYSDSFDLKWLAELIESVLMILIGVGFTRPAFYSKKMNRIGPNDNLQEPNRTELFEDNKKQIFESDSDILQIELLE